MHQDDDQILPGKHAHEATLGAMLEAGLLGFPHHGLDTEADLTRFHEHLKGMGDAIVIFRVPYDVGRMGASAGAAAGRYIIGASPANVSMMFAFDGYADDPRELFQVPEVVEFCRGVLLGPDLNAPDPSFAKVAVPRLIDEMSFPAKDMDPYTLTGRHWLVSIAFHKEVFFRDGRGWGRWVDVGDEILKRLLR